MDKKQKKKIFEENLSKVADKAANISMVVLFLVILFVVGYVLIKDAPFIPIIAMVCLLLIFVIAEVKTLIDIRKTEKSLYQRQNKEKKKD
jgi:Na+/citrate or Na+/malate symporter